MRCDAYEVTIDRFARRIISRCRGTKEKEGCTCGGNTAKCDFYPEKRKPKPITNYERIKAMSVDEMAKFITKEKTRVAKSVLKVLDLDISTDAIITSYEVCKAWLESEAKE